MTLDINLNNDKACDIDISVQDPAWETRRKGIEKEVLGVAELTLKTAILPKIAIGRPLEASIVLANNDLLQVLNREYREKDKPTNILTFAAIDSEEPYNEGVLSLGDVILSFEVIKKEAIEKNVPFMDHVKHLVAHGVLHLLGYDHEDDNDATDMETLEIRILEQLGIQNPYMDV